LLTLDPTMLLVGLVASGAGLVLFTYGRKQQRLPQLAGGVALIVYPYAVSTVVALVVVGLLIGGAVWVATRLGW